jgi:RNA polymerase sigma-70 factor (ECF subfamily)
MDTQDAAREEVLRLFLKHQVMVSSYLYTLLEDWTLVEEALQETAVFICSRWQDFTPGTNFGAWARAVALMRGREALQRRRQTAHQSLDAVVHDLAGPITAEEWDRHGAFSPRHKEALAQCIRGLPDDQRQVVEMHYLEQQQCERIAVRLAKRVEAVYMMLSRIRRRLKKCVEQRLAREAV